MALGDHVADRRIQRGRSREAATEQSPCIGPLPAFLAAEPTYTRTGNDNRPHFADRGSASELDCLRHLLAPELLHAAEMRARELGIGADQVLIRSGILDEAAYLHCLADHTGIDCEDFFDVGRDATPLRDDQMPHAAASGIVPLRQDGRLIWTLAPRRLAARTLCQLVARHPEIRPDMRLASSASVERFLTRQGGPALTKTATRGLGDRHPTLTAAPASTQSGWRSRLRRGCCVAAIVLLPPLLMPQLWSVTLALAFLAIFALRLASAAWPQRGARELPPLPDSLLPTYSVVVALYREATSVAPLVRAINALDYPREKLDVILAVEPDDLETHAAIARLGRMPHVRMLVVPAAAPRTKPKALNWALPFAHGGFVAVYDAEDRPEPGQLRAAIAAFRARGKNVACAQASLCIDNETHSWLSRMFAAEYAGQFDVSLPGMSAMSLPLPLGGSSNHFRTSVLRDVGGWDAFNVTEDADLGFRLARFGYRSVTFPSTTFEEAPIRFSAWLKQRSRWMKGWLQTWCVHMRHPRQLWRDTGPAGFFAINIIAGGNVLTALAYPVMLYAVLAYALNRVGVGTTSIDWPAPLYLLAFMSGIASTITLGLLGLSRRRRLRECWILLLTAPYWVCLSIAAWRAVFQYIWNPYHWEKTEHGVAKRARPKIESRPNRRIP